MSQIPEALWGRALPPPRALCKARMENTALMNLHQGFGRRIARAAGPSKDTDPAQCKRLVFRSFPSTERQCRAGEMAQSQEMPPSPATRVYTMEPTQREGIYFHKVHLHHGTRLSPTPIPCVHTQKINMAFKDNTTYV